MLIIGVILDGYRALKDKTLKLTFETTEPNPEQLTQLTRSFQKSGFLAFKVDEFKTNELEVLDSLKSDYNEKGKSKSQRLKAVLYRNWEQKNLGYEVFDDYYNHRMEKLITALKNKLE